MTIEQARPSDRAAAEALLRGANLPLDGIDEHFGHFIVARGGDGALIGLAGIEFYGASALIRSVVVAPSHRRTGLGRRLVDAIIALAKSAGVGTLYLLTEGAQPFFESLGFEPIERSAADPHVASSPQFHIAPCRAATCLRRSIS
jgi:amino-acid N-acetyltransferase